MTVYIQFGIFFLLLVFAASELIAGLLLIKEILRRRGQKHLSLFCVYFLTLGVGGLLWFLGGFFDSQGLSNVGRALSSVFVVFTIIGSFFYGFAFVELYSSGIRKRALETILFATALTALVISEKSTTEAFGIHLAVGGARSFSISYGYWMLTNVLGAVLVTSSCRRSLREKRASCQADRFLMIGSMLSVATGLTTIMFLAAELWVGALFIYAMLTLSVVCKYLGANAKHHPDVVISRDPRNVIRGTLMGKVLIVSTLFFTVMTFMLLASTSNFFVARSLAERESGMKEALDGYAGDIRDIHVNLMFGADLISRHSGAVRVLSGEPDAIGPLSEAVESWGNDSWLDIVDPRGDILASSIGGSGEPQQLSDSAAVHRALDGNPSAAIERDASIGAWVVRAADPVTDASGSTLGAVVISRPLSGPSLSVCGSGPAMTVSGCGHVSAFGDMIASSGVIPDAVDFGRFRSSIDSRTGSGRGETDDYHLYLVREADNAFSESGGFIYSLVTRADLESDLFRLLSAIVVISALFLAAASILLAFGVALLLRPLKKLKGVADRVSGGDYGVSVEYESPDEIGRLAEAFNRMSQAIRDRTKSLNDKVREQRDFLSNTAHEIRTPLNIFRWSLEMLRFGDVGKLNDEQMELVDQMHQTNERVRIMVDRLLSLSRMDRGIVRLKREPVAVEDVIDEVAGAISVKVRERKIDFYWKRPEEALPKAYADKTRLYEVIMNLVGNAVKFTGKEGHIFVAAAESDVSGPSGRKGRFLHVQVEDNGRGIPQDQQKYMFRRFFRARNVLNEEIEGTGLGLHIAKMLVEMQGGEMWFESEENIGSTFHFTVPAADGGVDAPS